MILFRRWTSVLIGSLVVLFYLFVSYGKPTVQRWPIICNTTNAEPAYCLKRYIDLSSVHPQMYGGTDAYVSVDHSTLFIIGIIFQDLSLFPSTFPLWCEFNTGEISAGGRDALDSHSHTFIRTCPIPALVQTKLDDLNYNVTVRFIQPYSNNATTLAKWYPICPHAFRCPPSQRSLTKPTFSSLTSSTYQYEVAICSLVNSPFRVLEWILFYQMMGIEHFFLYVQASQEEIAAIRKILELLIHDNYVTLIPWNPEEFMEPMRSSHWGARQTQANNHCLSKYGMLAKWIGILDRDEYIVPLGKYESLPQVLRALDDPSMIAIGFSNWFYGQGEIQKGELLIEERIYKERQISEPLRRKLFMKTDRTYMHSVHVLTSPFDHQRDMTTTKVANEYNEARMVHYKESHRHENDYVYDDHMLAYASELHRRQNKISV